MFFGIFHKYFTVILNLIGWDELVEQKHNI
jgi:hypothetical protein